MIELYAWGTQNARKVSIMLEECALTYVIRPVNLMQNRQKEPGFVSINPNGRIPALVDTADDGKQVVVAESGAILIYLAEKTGSFLPASGPERYQVLHWLMWQMSGVGPTFGNLAHFVAATNPDSPRVNAYLRATMAPEVHSYSLRRFADEASRLVCVLEALLGDGRDFMTGGVSIADFATYAWFESIWPGFQARRPSMDDDYPRVADWMKRLAARPGVRRGMARLAWGVDLEAQGSVHAGGSGR